MTRLRRGAPVPALIPVAALAVALATLGGAVAGPMAGAQTTTTAPPTTAAPTTTTLPAGPLTANTVSVGGIVSDLSGDVGADVGAQARFARANARGGVVGRRIVYVGTERPTDAATSAAAVARLAPRVFAVVPAASPVLDPGALGAVRLPFFGPADDASWTGVRQGFGFAGAQVPAPSRTASPAWGITLRALLGGSGGRTFAVLTTADGTGTRSGAAARASLRAAGFTVPAPIVAGAGIPTATDLAKAGPDGVVLLVDAPTVVATAAGLAATGYIGTVATGPAFYRPEVPAVGRGITVLLPYAPPEQATAANRRLLADVEHFAPGTAVTPGVVAGYWAADEFLAVLAKAGRGAGKVKLLRVASNLEYEVSGTLGPTKFPGAHSQPAPCGALAQGDGTLYVVSVTYRCGSPVPLASAARR